MGRNTNNIWKSEVCATEISTEMWRAELTKKTQKKKLLENIVCGRESVWTILQKHTWGRAKAVRDRKETVRGMQTYGHKLKPLLTAEYFRKLWSTAWSPSIFDQQRETNNIYNQLIFRSAWKTKLKILQRVKPCIVWAIRMLVLFDPSGEGGSLLMRSSGLLHLTLHTRETVYGGWKPQAGSSSWRGTMGGTKQRVSSLSRGGSTPRTLRAEDKYGFRKQT